MEGIHQLIKIKYIIRFMTGYCLVDLVGLWYLTPHSAIFQLYRGGQFNCWRKPGYPEKTTDLP